MRLKLGRPDIARYADRFDVPPATGELSVTFLGVSSLLFNDGEHAVLTDGFFSRPTFGKLALTRIAPDERRIDAALTRAGIGRLDAVIPVHAHYDHALDVAVVAARTGATLLGSGSAANIGRGGGLPERQVSVAQSPHRQAFGSFTLTLISSVHSPPDRAPGRITAPLTPPARARAYRCGEAWSVLVEHHGGRSALVQGSAGFVPGALAGQHADVVYLGIAQLGPLDDDYVSAYWEHTVRAVGARRAIFVHWDDFFRPLDQPLRALPFAVDDLDVTIRRLDRLAAADGVTLHFPTVWQREDPWLGLA